MLHERQLQDMAIVVTFAHVQGRKYDVEISGSEQFVIVAQSLHRASAGSQQHQIYPANIPAVYGGVRLTRQTAANIEKCNPFRCIQSL